MDTVFNKKRVLEPNERIAEVLFGLIMALTFTGSLSVADSGRDDVRMMLIGALGCNIAWGIIDGILYLMGCLSEQGRGIKALKALRGAKTSEEAHSVIADVLPPAMASALGPVEYEAMRQKLLLLPELPLQRRLGWKEWKGALAVFLLVFLVTFPVAIPFIFMQDLAYAMRVSNAVAIFLLFLTGYEFGRVAQYRPWRMGLAMVLLGVILVILTITLGG